MNPYEAPETATPQIRREDVDPSRLGPGMIAAILALGVFIGLLAQLFASVRVVTMPRFGWIGLILCANPLIFLLIWLRTPTRPTMIASAFMACTLGVINGAMLLVTGTVSIVANVFSDRLHSSWYWSVLPFFVAGAYLYWRALRMNPHVVSTEMMRPEEM